MQSEGIQFIKFSGGEYLAANIQKVAEKTSKIVVDHSSRIRSSLTPGDKPMHVTPMVRFGVHYVHKGSKVVAKCTKYLCKFCSTI